MKITNKDAPQCELGDLHAGDCFLYSRCSSLVFMLCADEEYSVVSLVTGATTPYFESAKVIPVDAEIIFSQKAEYEQD